MTKIIKETNNSITIEINGSNLTIPFNQLLFFDDMPVLIENYNSDFGYPTPSSVFSILKDELQFKTVFQSATGDAVVFLSENAPIKKQKIQIGVCSSNMGLAIGRNGQYVKELTKTINDTLGLKLRGIDFEKSCVSQTAKHQHMM